VRALIVLVLLVAVAAVGALALLDDGDGVVASARRVVDRAPPARPLRPALCPDDVARCRVVTGRVVFVEARDPDGDGDLHVVVADGGISAPGVTSVDISPRLRPRRDPRVGDVVSAAGPVQRGSIGQAQIHALDVAVARRRPS
jgi:hypothetical protein